MSLRYQTLAVLAILLVGHFGFELATGIQYGNGLFGGLRHIFVAQDSEPEEPYGHGSLSRQSRATSWIGGSLAGNRHD